MSWKINPDGTAERPHEQGGTRKLLIKPKFAVVAHDKIFGGVYETTWKVFDTEGKARQFIKEFVEARNCNAD